MYGFDVFFILGYFNYVVVIVVNLIVLLLLLIYCYSGVSSMKIIGLGVVFVILFMMIFVICNELDEFIGFIYVVSECMCVKFFQLYVDKDYLVSVWVKGGYKDVFGNYDKLYVKIIYILFGIIEYVYVIGQVIDGW